ncbi:hemocyanin 1 [Biomphalaria glabrata]|nr:hemocyanin 1 [Biomphalaria glabrata]
MKGSVVERLSVPELCLAWLPINGARGATLGTSLAVWCNTWHKFSCLVSYVNQQFTNCSHRTSIGVTQCNTWHKFSCLVSYVNQQFTNCSHRTSIGVTQCNTWHKFSCLVSYVNQQFTNCSHRTSIGVTQCNTWHKFSCLVSYVNQQFTNCSHRTSIGVTQCNTWHKFSCLVSYVNQQFTNCSHRTSIGVTQCNTWHKFSCLVLRTQGEEGVTKILKLVEAELAKVKIKYAVSYLTNFMELEHSQEIKNKQLKQAKDNRKMALNKKDQIIELLKRELQELRKATNN